MGNFNFNFILKSNEKIKSLCNRKKNFERTFAFAKGIILSDKTWDTKVVPLKDFFKWISDDLNKGDAIATWGILRGTGLLLNEAKREIDYFFMDHGYFKSLMKMRFGIEL